jgi:DNA replication protein DnaC
MEKILSQLREMRLSGMAQTWQNLMESRQAQSLDITDGLRLLVQGELDMRRANRNNRLLHNAHFRYDVSVDELAYNSTRGLDKSFVTRLCSGEYIRHGIPVIITGATGTGKSWLASALGNHACISGFKTRYWSILKLMEELTMARVEKRLKHTFDKTASYDLLIIDDFGIKKLNNEQILDLMEIIEDRHGRKATIIVSQIPVSDWYDCLETNTTAADAILDRLIHSAIRFELKGDSLRKNH